ncbi:type I restriction-modification system subunit M N-terminal domain-containing protein [Veillonella magna]|uniref:type I restriction-modification system subunit M N-terminal domain-containing protein n=1 Tax=Veillonella magna TaxID=464322 RepID=UPI000425F26F|nr:type I restriction-modification system subunit M N-terminal domain-containing protein [Veillonella magna]
MAAKSTADIGFEKEIWDAACVLRGNIDASEYKSVVLGLIFLKYISDRFDEKYQALVEEGEGFEEDRDEYLSDGIFFVPAGARWNEIAAKSREEEIGTVIDNAMRAIEKKIHVSRIFSLKTLLFRNWINDGWVKLSICLPILK